MGGDNVDDFYPSSLDQFEDMPGKVTWICRPCLKNHQTMKDIKLDSERMHAKMDDLVNLVQNLLIANNTYDACSTSPPRKAAKIGVNFNKDHSPSFTPLQPMSSFSLPGLDVSQPHDSNSKTEILHAPTNQFKLNLKKDDGISHSALLHELHTHVSENNLPTFSGRKKKDGSHDVVFKSYSDACKAKNILDKKLDNVIKVSIPKHDTLKKYRLVGLEFDMSTEEITDSIIRENSWLNMEKIEENAIQVKNDPNSVLYVNDVLLCRNKLYRMVNITMSSSMLASIGHQRIALGYVKCKLYVVSSSSRCYHCQRHGHYADQCENKLACSRCALEHRTDECTSSTYKCVNCVNNGKEVFNHPSYSRSCPYNN